MTDVCLPEIGAEARRLLKCADSLPCSFCIGKCKPQRVISPCVGRLDTGYSSEVERRFLETTDPRESIAEIQVRSGVCRMNRERLLVFDDRLVEPSLIRQGVAQAVVCLCIARSYVQSVAEKASRCSANR